MQRLRSLSTDFGLFTFAAAGATARATVLFSDYFENNNLNNWTVTSPPSPANADVGTFTTSTVGFADPANGTYSMYADWNANLTGSATLTQNAQRPTATLGTTYTFSLYDISRYNTNQGEIASASILVGGTPVSTNTNIPAYGMWTPLSVSYTATAADVNQPIGGQFTFNVDSSEQQVWGDDVVLSASTPEPASLSLLLIAGGVTLIRRRRR